MTIPQWLDTKEYPFTSHHFKLHMGNMHYIDEGKGEPIIFIHGNPTWSFLYRKLVKAFSNTHRCIAVDHIGFGLSSKPSDWSYLPEEHAKNLDKFLESLDLHNITLVVGDWGGPIGLSYAINHPERIKNIVITNTWLWSLKTEWYYQLFSKIAGGFVGQWLLKNFLFLAKKIIKTAFRNKLSPEILNHYLMPLYGSQDRKGCTVFPKQVIQASDWLNSLWSNRNALQEKNMLIAWGMKDLGFRNKELQKWIKSFPLSKVSYYENVGHFVPEENSDELIDDIKNLM